MMVKFHLLRHIICPFFALLHAALFVTIVVVGDKHTPANIFRSNAALPPLPDAADLSLVESHALGALAGCHAAFMYAMGMAMYQPRWYAGMALGMETLFLALDTYDMVRLGMTAGAMYAFTGMAAVGLVFHIGHETQPPAVMSTTTHRKRND